MDGELKYSSLTQLRSDAAPTTSSRASGSRRSRRPQKDTGARQEVTSNAKRLPKPPQSGLGSKGDDEGECKAYGLKTHALLSTIGAPTITHADLQRICEDAIGFEDALKLFEAHIVGRGEVNRVRQTIARKMLADGSSFSLGQDGDAGSAYTQHFEATRRLCAAEAELERIQREVDDTHTRLIDLEQEIDALQTALRQKRLANALLSVLEKKEKIRMRRVEEIGGIFCAIRDGAQSVTDRTLGATSDAKMIQDMPRQKLRRADAVQDTLAMLQGYHSHLAQFANKDDQLDPSRSEAYLLKKISEVIGRPQDDTKVQKTFKAYLAEANRRASQRFRYASPLIADHKVRINNQALTTLERQVIEKEIQLQTTNAHISALRMSCIESLHLLTAFRDSTVPILQQSLDEDTNAAKNHLHILRKSIEQGCINLTPSLSPVQSYQGKVMLVRANILAEHGRRHFLAAAALHPPVNSTRNEDTLSRFRAEQSRFEEGLRKVLQRKVDKSQVGDELLQDIKTLVDEIRTVANVL